MPKKTLIAYAALLIVTLIWSAATPVIKLTLQYVPVFTFLFLRFLIVCIVLLPFTILELKKNPVHKKDLINFLLLGIFSQSGIAFIFVGLKYTTALDATVIGIMAPLLSVAAGHYFFREKVSTGVKVGVILAVIGTLLVVFEPVIFHTTEGTPTILRLFGNLLVIAYNFTFLMYIIWSKISLGQNSQILKKTLHFIHLKPMTKKYSEFMLTSVTFYVALATFIPLAILEHVKNPDFRFTAMPVTPFLGILFMSLLSSIVAYSLFEWALNKVTVSDTAIFSYLTPIFTVPFAFLLVGETPSKLTLIGSAIIALGVVIAEKKKA